MEDCSQRRSSCPRQGSSGKIIRTSADLTAKQPAFLALFHNISAEDFSRRIKVVRRCSLVFQVQLPPQTPQEHKFFDSADWALSKQGVKSEQQQIPAASHLEPKLTPSDNQPPRRASHLGEEG